ncbi:protocatechuate 3,4-dioxygenase subunit beta, partial [Burkholderia multivorans]
MSATRVPGPDDAAESQATLSAEIDAIGTEYRDAVAGGAPAETQPRL